MIHGVFIVMVIVLVLMYAVGSGPEDDGYGY